MSDCARCGNALRREVKRRARCYRCGACEHCCGCAEGADTEGYNFDDGSFDRDELGIDPEDDA
jgi:hypothetical protein